MLAVKLAGSHINLLHGTTTTTTITTTTVLWLFYRTTCWPAPPVKNWRILLEQSFAASLSRQINMLMNTLMR